MKLSLQNNASKLPHTSNFLSTALFIFLTIPRTVKNTILVLAAVVSHKHNDFFFSSKGIIEERIISLNMPFFFSF